MSKTVKEIVSETLQSTFVGITLAMAHEVGIIQALIEADTHMTSQEIADSKTLKERYVREILNALACSHMVEVERKDGSLQYYIPADQKSAFDAVNAPFIGLVSSCAVRFQELEKCIRKDGPYDLPYGDNPQTLEAISLLSVARIDTEIQIMLDNVPGLKAQLESGIHVIEFGSGGALFISEMARRFPKSEFTGSDYSAYTVAKAQGSLVSSKLTNLSLKVIDIYDIPSEHVAVYDFAFVNDVIHDLPDSDGGLRGLHKVLKPGCYMAMIEIGLANNDVMVHKNNPIAAMLYSVSSFHCVPQAYYSASANPLGCCWGKDTALQYVERNGFKIVSHHDYSHVFVMIIGQALYDSQSF